VLEPTPVPLTVLVTGSSSGFGRKAARRVTHHVALSLIPNWVGRPQRRAVDPRADSLTLTAEPSRLGGELATPRLTWRRH
jgi:NAD(P)-dependent dehydrogenase (short-subunit alcohol dehydrogenase family)